MRSSIVAIITLWNNSLMMFTKLKLKMIQMEFATLSIERYKTKENMMSVHEKSQEGEEGSLKYPDEKKDFKKKRIRI